MSVPRIKVQGIETSALGLGCAALGGRVSLRHGRRMVDAAHDAGVTHFDVARSYGYGLAESGLSRFLKSNRDHVTLATKAGIRPNMPPWSARALGPLARRARSIKGARASTVRTLAGSSLGHTPMRRHDLEVSLLTSLRNLGTDYVDLLFLHEPKASQVTDEVLSWLDEVRTAGWARRVGISTTHAPEVAFNAFPDWLTYQVSFDQLPKYRGMNLEVFGVHSLFRNREADSNPLGVAAREGVVCLASMYTSEHLASNCASISFETRGVTDGQ